MFFKATTVALFAATAALAAPVEPRNQLDIIVQLTGDNARPWTVGGFSSNRADEFASKTNPGPFNKVQLFFSESIKQRQPGIENSYRCALTDDKGNRIITTRGDSIDFTFGDNNRGAWTLKNGPFSNVKVTCDPSFSKTSPEDAKDIRVLLQGDSELARTVNFENFQGDQRVEASTGGAFKRVTLSVGPAIDNQKLRCQLTDAQGKVVLLDRGANKNKETFGDAGKGAWTLDVAGDGVAEVSKVTCDPTFV